MTPEQVSALSDAELNRAMIWLYPPTDGVIYNGAIDMYLARYMAMNYLASYDLIMPLVIEEQIQITPKPYAQDMWKAYRSIGSRSFSASNKKYLRAAC